MNTRPNATRTCLLGALVLGACGGGGGPTDPTGVPLPGNPDALFGQSCDNDYYRELIGTYRGNAVYDPSASLPNYPVRCDWTMEMRVEVDSDTNRCLLRVVTTSEVEQSTVLPADDENAYQCVGENGVRDLYEPNDSDDPSTFEDVAFPVIADVDIQIDVPRTSPYFGDPSSEVRNVYLFDGLSSVVDLLEFDGQGMLRLLDGNDESYLSARLNKE